jgi:general secretion pathway protein D
MGRFARRVSLCAFSAIFCMGTLMPAIVYADTTQGAPQTYAFVFKDADINQVADEILGHSLNVSYRVEPGVAGKMNFRIEQRLTRAQLLAAFEAALANYDVVMVKDGETIVLRPRDKAQVGGQISTTRTSGIGYQIRAIPINYGSASEIAKALETVTHANMVLYSSDKLGLILIGGRSEEIDNAAATIALFDQSSLSDSRIRFFPLNNASATTVSDDLEKLLKASETSGVTIVPMTRLNGIFAFSKSADVLTQVSALITRLDIASNDQSIHIWVYHPKGGSAESLVRTLSTVLGLSSGSEGQSTSNPSMTTSPANMSMNTSTLSGASGTSGGTGLSSSTGMSQMPSMTSMSPSSSSSGGVIGAGNGDTRIVADKDTNSIIVDAPEATRVRILNVLNEIDHEPAQVFIEASILEVTLTKDLNYGIDWKQVGGKLTSSSYSSAGTSFSSIAPGLSINYLGNNLEAAITALGSQSKVKIMSAPKITTVENGTAVLQVGDQVPIVTQTAQSTATSNAPLVNTVSYMNTGVMLQVTPRISAGDHISLDVSQQVSSVSQTTTSGIDSPTISQRQMQSRLIVPEGTVVALGGLISTDDSYSDQGVPVLKNVPLLGNLFKGVTKNSNRTELVVLLQAHIIRDDAGYGPILANVDSDLKDMMHDGDWLRK